jgi:RNA polymerase-binding transcription factor DksA
MTTPRERSPREWARLEADLRQQLQTLTARLANVDRDLRGPHDDDAEERAIETENDQVLERLDAATRAEVGLILRALRRIANGSYGTCAVCGGAIDAERLRLLPTAIACRRCAVGA